jgi:hypothetical protein
MVDFEHTFCWQKIVDEGIELAIFFFGIREAIRKYLLSEFV